MKRVGLLIVCLLVFGMTVANSSEHQWQTGILADVSAIAGPSFNGTQRSGNQYTIETDSITYVTEEWPVVHFKPASTAIGSKVQFYVEKDHLFLKGVDGKEHKTNIVKTIPKKPQG